MKNIKRIIVCIFLMHISCDGATSSITDAVGIPESKALFKSISEEKVELLNELNKEKTKVETEKASALKSTTTNLEENKNKRTAVESQLEKEPEDEFLVKKLSLLTEINDVLRDIQLLWEGLLKKISDHITLLDNFLKDPELVEYTKEIKVSTGPYFFEDLEDAHQKVSSQQKFVDQLKRRKESALKEQKNMIQALEKATEDYKERKSKQEDFNKAPSEVKGSNIPFSLSTTQRAELLTLESDLFKLKKDAADLQLKEKKQEASLIEDELFVETLHLDVLQDIEQKIKHSITVTLEQTESAFQELDKKKQAFSTLKAKYNDEINKLRKLREDENAKLTALSTRYSIPLGNELNTWSIEPKKTLESYKGLIEVGSLNTYVQLLDEREAYFAALIALEQEKINYAEELAKVKETYYKISSRKFISEDEIGQEIKKYTKRQAANLALIKSYKVKKSEVETTLVKLQNEVLERLKKRKADVQQQKDTLFKGKINEYAATLSLLDKAEEYVTFRTDVVTNTGKSYAEIIGILHKISGHSKFVLSELESITIWYRPEYAISWAGIQSIGPDIKMFFADVRAYLWQFDTAHAIRKLKNAFDDPLQFILFVIMLAALWSLLLLIRRYAPLVVTLLRVISEQSQKTRSFFNSLLRSFLLTIALLIGFIGRYAIAIGIWGSIAIIAQEYMIVDPHLYILFYLFSIPYLLYLANKFLHFTFVFNEKNGYFLMNQDSYIRCQIIWSATLYSTIVLMLFQRAFGLAQFPKSELPHILSTINLIIVQISLIFLISKEQVLDLFPTKYVSQTLFKLVDRYYYVFVLSFIVIIILINPYIGYGRLVLYLVWGLIKTIILFKVLHWIHSLIKRGSSLIFFSTEEEVVRERFPYAKTWFGITIIVSFLCLALVGVIIGAQIWGWPIVFKDVLRWLNQPILGIGKGTTSPLTSISILTIVLFILAGFIVSFAFNRFVLDKVFDLMLVDAGVQNAIANLTRYILVATAILLGFHSVGYGGLVTYMYVFILGVGYLVQNPLHDLIAYFIILLQRPIKVGDYIQIDEETMGIVRKITPKSVTLRRKNSTTIVVPNALIINKPVTNWNYARNFIAFNDISIAVSYKEDPAKVKDLLFSAVDSHPNVLKNPKPVIRLEEFREEGFRFMVRGFLSSTYTMEQWEIASDVRLAIVKILREHGVDIAVPVRIIVNAQSLSEDDQNNDRHRMMLQ